MSEHKKIWKLREIQSLLSKGPSTDFGSCYPAYYEPTTGERVYLPQLREAGNPWPGGNCELSEYLRRIDQRISKYGPNAEYEAHRRWEEDHGDDKPINHNESKGDSDEQADELNKGGGQGESPESGANAQSETSAQGQGQSEGSGQTMGKNEASNTGHSGGPTSSGGSGEGNGQTMGQPSSNGSPGKSPGSREGRSSDSEGFGKQGDNAGQPKSSNQSDGRQGVQTEKNRSFGEGVDRPSSEGRDNTLKGGLDDDGRRRGFPTVKTLDPGGDASTPFFPYEGTRGLHQTIAESDDSGVAPAPTSRMALEEFKSLFEAIQEDGGLHTARSINNNPGGVTQSMIGDAYGFAARMPKKDIRRVKQLIDRMFKSFEQGTFGEFVPRIDPTKLVKELVGKSYRLGRCAEESQESGLKVLLVDNSGSCHSICGPAMAACIELARADPDIVIYVHSNGWATGDAYRDDLIGVRAHEVVGIRRGHGIDSIDLKGVNIAGVVAFGDWDAVDLYQQLVEVAPLIWIDPSDDANAWRGESCHSIVEHKNTLYIPCMDWSAPLGWSAKAIDKALAESGR